MDKIFIKGLIERKANGGYSVVASTSTIDRQGDSIDQSGWDLKNFLKNPVMLWAHDYSSLPIAKANEISVDKDKGLVITDYEFAPAEGNPMAAQVKALVDGGFLNAVSVGFMPLERNGNIITRMELFEVSFVPVPANPEALQLMFSKGIEKSVIEKFFEAKAEEIEEAEKGAVADEVNAEEVIEQKWEKWDEVCEILGALWTVFFDEKTSVDSLPTLLKEAAQLLSDLADAGVPIDDETVQASLKELMKKSVSKEAAKTLIVKIGAQHSKKTKDALNEAITHNDSASALLKELLKSNDESGSEEETGKSEPVVEENKDTAEGGVDEVRALLITRSLLRENETGSRSALGAINALLKEKREVAEVK